MSLSQHPTRPAKRSLGDIVSARAKITLAVVGGFLILLIFVQSFGRGVTSNRLAGRVTVRLFHDLPTTPEAYFAITKTRGDGTQQTVLSRPLRFGELADSARSKTGSPTEVFHYMVELRLSHFVPRGTDVFYAGSDVLFGGMMTRRLWCPEEYRLQVTSPLNIKSEPSYYRVSELDFEGNDFVVTVLEGTQR